MQISFACIQGSTVLKSYLRMPLMDHRSSEQSGDIHLSLFFLAHCFYQRTITWSMLFFRRTIIPHKKVLQKGREQILFFALALILRRLLPPLHQHTRLTYCLPLRPILPPAPVYNAAVDSLSTPAYKRRGRLTRPHRFTTPRPVHPRATSISPSDHQFHGGSFPAWHIR